MSARDGVDAVEILKVFQIALIIAPIDLPAMDRFQLMKFRNKHCPQIPFLDTKDCAFAGTVHNPDTPDVTGRPEKPREFDELISLIRNKLHVH